MLPAFFLRQLEKSHDVGDAGARGMSCLGLWGLRVLE